MQEKFLEIYGGYSRRKRTTSSDIARLKRGGRKADEIQKISDTHHQDVEIPLAEEFLEYSLETVSQEKKISFASEKILLHNTSFFSRLWTGIKNFFRSLFFHPNR